MGRRKYTLIGAALLVIVLLLWWAGIEDVLEILETARPDYFLMAIVVYIASLITWALRWRVLLKSLGVKANFATILEGLLVGIFINNITPGARGGGEPVRAYYIHKKTGDPYGPIFATVMIDRLTDVIPVMMMLILGTVYVYGLGSMTLMLTLLILDAFFVGMTLVSAGIILSEQKTKSILYWLYRQFGRIMPKKAMNYEEKFVKTVEVSVPQFQDNLRILLTHKKAFILSVSWSFITWTLIILRSYYIFYSINSPIRLLDIMVVQMVGIAVGMFAVVPGGAGLIAAVNSAVYVLLGINKEIAVTATLLERLISYWAPTIIGAGLTTRFGAMVKKLKRKAGDNNINVEDENKT